MGQIIAVINQKGGTGKTTTTINLGSGLAQKGNKILLIDFDQQGNLSYSLGINELENTISEVLLDETSLESVVVERENMSIAPGDNRLADAELTLADEKDRENKLNAFLKNHKFDYVLIDCPPSLSLLTLNALMAAAKVLIPMQMEVLSLQGLDHILNTVDEVRDTFKKKIDIAGILPVLFDKRRKLSQEVMEHISTNYDIRIYDSFIRTNVSASEAPSFGKSVISYKPSSNSAKDYINFTNEFLNKS